MPKIRVQINGDPMDIDSSITILELLDRIKASGNHLAVAINNEVIRRSDFEKKVIHEGDSVEILHPVGGG